MPISQSPARGDRGPGVLADVEMANGGFEKQIGEENRVPKAQLGHRRSGLKDDLPTSRVRRHHGIADRGLSTVKPP